jgi:hypothetical protein
MTNSIALFSNDTAVVSYANKKGDQFAISTEGALFKGGQALKALKEAASTSAKHKAESGRYRAAADILGASFPAMTKAFDKFFGAPAWTSKLTMCVYLDKLESLQPTAAKGWNTKQVEARALMQHLRTLPALAKAESTAFTIEA